MNRDSTSHRSRVIRIGVLGYFGIFLALVTVQAAAGESMEPYDLALQFVRGGGILAAIGFVAFFSGAIPMLRFRRFLSPDFQSAQVRDYQADYLLSLSIAAALVVITSLVGLRIMTGNEIRSLPAGTYPHVGSMRTGLEEFKIHALRWHSDAYLVNASLALHDDSYYRMEATYESTTSSQWYLDVVLVIDGTISTRIREFGNFPDSDRRKAILDTDWKLDSEDALRIFAKNKGVSSCLMAFPQHANSLELSSWKIAGKSRVGWILHLPDCYGMYFYRIAIDAVTGKWLRIPG